MCKSKIHRATVTHADLYYEGSLTVDTVLIDAAGMLPYEQVSVVNINNGNRFETYLIPGKKNSGIIGLNGAAARLGAVGDQVIIISYGLYDEKELKNFKPRKIFVDNKNRIKKK